MPLPDYYHILGVSRAAKPHEIKAAYRRLARRYHPDLHPHNPRAEEIFKSINQAYSVLGDALQRRQYDAQTPPALTTSYAAPARPAASTTRDSAVPRRAVPRRSVRNHPLRPTSYLKVVFLMWIIALLAVLAFSVLFQPRAPDSPPATVTGRPGQIELTFNTPQQAVFFADGQGVLYAHAADAPKKFLGIGDKIVLPYAMQTNRGRVFIGIQGEATGPHKAAPVIEGEWIERTQSGTLEILIPQAGVYVIFLNVEDFAGTVVVNPQIE